MTTRLPSFSSHVIRQQRRSTQTIAASSAYYNKVSSNYFNGSEQTSGINLNELLNSTSKIKQGKSIPLSKYIKSNLSTPSIIGEDCATFFKSESASNSKKSKRKQKKFDGDKNEHITASVLSQYSTINQFNAESLLSNAAFLLVNSSDTSE